MPCCAADRNDQCAAIRKPVCGAPVAGAQAHNIAGSIIVLDEAQTLPRPLLLPALRMLDVLCRYYGCSVVLCTATQPAFDSRQLGQGGLKLQGREIAPDPEGLAKELRRARIVQAGPMDDDTLIGQLTQTTQGFVIVNSRKHALDLYQLGKGTEGLIHLTTRQYPAIAAASSLRSATGFSPGNPVA